MARNGTSVQPTNEETSKEILQFLKDGEREMEIGKFKNVTLVLGLTGTGKSTLTQFLTGYDEGLYAVETSADTGEFTIRDKNSKVCRGTIDSCTTIPTLYTDEETKSGYYDCPGFGDTRSVKNDISVTYFVKKVIDSVDAVKLLFTVSHHSVREGVDRQSFMKLIKNVYKMVKNIDKFKNSIALVVTKVDNAYNKKGMVPDAPVIRNIANFLKETRQSLEIKMQSKEDITFHTEAIKFINILLEKNGDDYPRIRLFRRPDEEGPLEKSALLQSGKARIRQMLQSFQYVPKTSEDFGYTVSAESLNQMHDLVDKVNEKLSATFGSMGHAIMEHYALEETKSWDLEELSKTMTAGIEALSAVREHRNYQSPQELSEELQKFAQTANITFSTENINEAAHYDNFLRFLHQISGLRTTSKEWLDGLREAKDFVSDRKEWLNLLVNLQTRLSEFVVYREIREDSRLLNALEQCITDVTSGSRDGACEELEGFLKQVFKNDLEKEYATARKVKPNVREWLLLEKLLDFSVIATCEDYHGRGILTITGQYVKLSDINGKTCPKSIRSVKIIALKKFFIDGSFRSLRIGDKFEVVIMAPHWEVIGSPTIVLDGSDGQDQQPRKALDGSTSGSWFGQMNGRHGNSGENGGEGGMFWGMAQHCTGCERLTVTANGGRGGAGQDGGDGAKGRDFHSHHEGEEHGWLVTVFYNKKVTDIKKYGQPGGNGGNGGDGGRGGAKGMVKFVRYGHGSAPRTSAIQGQPGRSGAGGAPGKGGRSERHIHRVHTILIVPWWGDEDKSLPPASDGNWGQNGVTPTYPTTPTGQFSNPSQTLSNYISLLRAKINNTPSDATARGFLHNLENARIDDVKHHVGRRSVSKLNDTNTTVNAPSFIHNAFAFVSNIMGISHKYSSIFGNTEQHISKPKFSVQEIVLGGSQPQNGMPKIASSSDGVLLDSSFGVSHVQSNLLLLDYLHRISGRARGDSKKNKIYSHYDDLDYAQRTAYRAHVPRN